MSPLVRIIVAFTGVVAIAIALAGVVIALVSEKTGSIVIGDLLTAIGCGLLLPVLHAWIDPR